MEQALFIFAGILSYLGIRSDFPALKLAAGFSWFAVWMYIKANPPSPLAEGSAAHTAILLVLILAGAAMLLTSLGGVVNRERNIENGSSFKFSNWKWRFGKDRDEYEGRRPTGQAETEMEYRMRVKRALHRK